MPAGPTPIYHPRAFATLDPDRPAVVLVDRGETLSYGELVQRSDRVAQLLACLGVRLRRGAADRLAALCGAGSGGVGAA
jgi:acyl-CoA synthetase (AMP-forming)/AMP-acid ligase II